MSNKILVTYKSVTGFTENYARMIKDELDCELIPFKNISSEKMAEFEIVIFGGRFHAGKVEGLDEARKLFKESRSKYFIVFATGATPNSSEEIINDMWKNNFSEDELRETAHFYMQSGLRYEKMPFLDKMMMKVFAAIVKRKKDKSEYEKVFENSISASHDISSKEYIEPLINYLKTIK